jgi:16S rRNA (guanine966-N2)-methyltransferase
MFSALSSMDADMSRVLDIYAGSGALGIEALSRGAASCDFVERDPSLCAIIRENLRVTGFELQARVHCLSAERALERVDGPYTLVLADPPYADAGAIRVLAMFAESRLLEAGKTVIVLEHGAKNEPSAALGPFSLHSARRHGDSAVSIYC